MHKQIEKQKENSSSDMQKNKSVANYVVQKKSNEQTTFQFVDKRPEVTTQLKTQEMANQAVQRKENKTGMPDNLKSGIENLSGMDMSDVKVHYNSPQPTQLQAHAFAQGNQIHIASGQEKHLPHEAWHVVQQKQGRVSPTKQFKGETNINDDAGLEKEADVMGAKALQFKKEHDLPPASGLPQNNSSLTTIQRQVIQFGKNQGRKGYYPGGDNFRKNSRGNTPYVDKPKTTHSESGAQQLYSKAEVANMTNNKILMLRPKDVSYWTKNYIQILSTTQFALLLTDTFSALPTDALENLSKEKTQSLGSDKLKSLTPEKFKLLNLSFITPEQAPYINNNYIPLLTSLKDFNPLTLNAFAITQFSLFKKLQLITISNIQAQILNVDKINAINETEFSYFIQLKSVSDTIYNQIKPKYFAKLHPAVIQQITSAQAKKLTKDQINQIPESDFLNFHALKDIGQTAFKNIKQELFGHMSKFQISTITANQTKELTKDQIEKINQNIIYLNHWHEINKDVIAVLPDNIMAHLRPEQLAIMKTEQVDKISTTHLAKISEEGIARLTNLKALKPAEFSKLKVDQLNALNAVQIKTITTGQIQALGKDIEHLALIGALSDDTFNAIDAVNFKDLKPEQIAQISENQSTKLTATKINKIDDTSIRLLKHIAKTPDTEFQQIDAAKVKLFSPDQIKTLSGEQLKKLKAGDKLKELEHPNFIKLTTLTALGINQLGAPQIQQLHPSKFSAALGPNIASISDTQFKYLTPKQIESIGTDIDKITVSQFPLLTANKWTVIAGNHFATIPDNHFAHITGYQIFLITENQAKEITSQQFNKIPNGLIKHVQPDVFGFLKNTVISGFTNTQLAEITVQQAHAMTLNQLKHIHQTNLKGQNIKALEVILSRLPHTGGNSNNPIPQINHAHKAGTLIHPGVVVAKISDFAVPVAPLVDDVINSIDFSAQIVQVPNIATFDIPLLNSKSLASTGVIGALSAKQIPYLTLLQLHQIGANINHLTDKKILTHKQTRSLPPARIDSIHKDLNIDQIKALTAKQIAGLNKATLEHFKGNILTPFQIKSIKDTTIDEISVDWFKALNSDQVHAFKIEYLDPTQLVKIKPYLLAIAQVPKVTDTQLKDASLENWFKEWSIEQIQAIPVAKIDKLPNETLKKIAPFKLTPDQVHTIKAKVNTMDQSWRNDLTPSQTAKLDTSNTTEFPKNIKRPEVVPIQAPNKSENFTAEKSTNQADELPADLSPNTILTTLGLDVKFLTHEEVHALMKAQLDDSDSTQYLTISQVPSIDKDQFPTSEANSKGQHGLVTGKTSTATTPEQLKAIENIKLNKDFGESLDAFQLQQLDASKKALEEIVQLTNAPDKKYLALSKEQVSILAHDKKIKIEHLSPALIAMLDSTKFLDSDWDKDDFENSIAAQIHAIPEVYFTDGKRDKLLTTLKAASDQKVKNLSPAQMSHLSNADIAGFTPAKLQQFTQNQLAGISKIALTGFINPANNIQREDHIERFTKDQIVWLLQKIDYNTVHTIWDTVASPKITPNSAPNIFGVAYNINAQNRSQNAAHDNIENLTALGENNPHTVLAGVSDTRNILTLLSLIPEDQVYHAPAGPRTGAGFVTGGIPHNSHTQTHPMFSVQNTGDIDGYLSIPPIILAKKVWARILANGNAAKLNGFNGMTDKPYTLVTQPLNANKVNWGATTDNSGNNNRFSNNPQQLPLGNASVTPLSNTGSTDAIGQIYCKQNIGGFVAYGTTTYATDDMASFYYYWCEHDIYPNQMGKNRGSYRIIYSAKHDGTVGAFSTVYFTPNHYQDFIRIQ